jgi:histone acetyltransferase
MSNDEKNQNQLQLDAKQSSSENLSPKDEIKLNSETGLGFTKRDSNVKQQEELGKLSFEVIQNDGTEKNMKLLIDLKNIIAKQLPKMPKEYIVRLVLDRRHESMIIIDKFKNKVLGGICYRPNKSQRFIEIAFLAISSLEQVKGYGTRLMNKLKDHCKNDYDYFLTYADNNAIGYFKKQGFNKALKMPKEQWKDYIKEYDGGTLMEASLNSKIDYSNLSNIIQEQKETLKNITKKFLNIKRKHSFKEVEDTFKTKNIVLSENKKNNNNNNIVPEINITKEIFEAIPGMLEAGWTFEDYKKQLDQEKDGENFLTQCREIIKKLLDEKASWPFRQPVNGAEIPDYYKKIKSPMDLSTLSSRLESGYLKTKASFVEELNKIFSNAKEYNKPGSFYYKSANQLEALIKDDIENLKNE